MSITCENQNACVQALEAIQPVVVAIVVAAVFMAVVWTAYTLRQESETK